MVELLPTSPCRRGHPAEVGPGHEGLDVDTRPGAGVRSVQLIGV